MLGQNPVEDQDHGHIYYIFCICVFFSDLNPFAYQLQQSAIVCVLERKRASKSWRVRVTGK